MSAALDVPADAGPARLAEPLDPAAIAALQALDPQQQNHLLRRVLQAYRESLANLVVEIRSVRTAAEPPLPGRPPRAEPAAVQQLAMMVHTLKSSSASIGARALASRCSAIERALRGQGRVDSPEAFDLLLAEAERVDHAALRWLDRLSGPPAP